MRPKGPKLASLAQKTCKLKFQIFGAFLLPNFLFLFIYTIFIEGNIFSFES